MLHKDFIKHTEMLFKSCLETMDSKGSEYSGTDDKFANFKRLSVSLGMPMEVILMVYFTKHIDSITSFVHKRSEGKTVAEIESGLSEPITGRIMDAINYLFILAGMVQEVKNDELIHNVIPKKEGEYVANNVLPQSR
jgi:hypothetical protein